MRFSQLLRRLEALARDRDVNVKAPLNAEIVINRSEQSIIINQRPRDERE